MKAETEFKRGDCVQLKSGGPQMTIGGLGEFGDVYCQWFDGTKLKGGNFMPEALKIVDAKV